MIAALLDGAQRVTDMRKLRQTLVDQIISSLRPAVAAAAARGQLRPDTTPEMFAMIALGALSYQRFIVDTGLPGETVDCITDAALRAWAPTRPEDGA